MTRLLLVVEGPGDLVVVTGAEIDHDVLVSEEEHHGAGVVQLVHVVEVGHLRFRERAEGMPEGMSEGMSGSESERSGQSRKTERKKRTQHVHLVS